jgi:antagonist of KipI
VKLEPRDVSEGSFLVEFPESPDDEANRAAVAIAARLSVKRPRGLLDAIPGAKTLFVVFDPRTADREDLIRRVRHAAEEEEEASLESRLFRIPVSYGGEAGSDLEMIARDRGLDPEEVARRHAAAEYRVAFLGFSPGFAYLTGLPAELAIPRRESPRARVPAGSVAIGGEYTAVYPTESPGGWRLIGRSPVRLFDPSASPPALLRAGDRVRFEPIDADELARRFAAVAPAKEPEVGGDPILATIAPGLFTSVRGGPQHGLGASGVPAGGAMDRGALARGNAILGNSPDAAALEISLSGPELRVLDDALFCVCGADLGARWNGKIVGLDVPFEVRAGDHLAFGYARRGARAYLCVRNGFVEARPGEAVRRLARGDVVSRARPAGRGEAVPTAAPPSEIPGTSPRTVRTLPGAQSAFFRASAAETFFSATWRVSSESDRRGIRLDGPPIDLRRPPDIPPEGTALGTIQVPASGLPIVLGPDRPVTGGYAKIATVVARDWPLLAQAAPGTAIRFTAVTLEEALAEL